MRDETKQQTETLTSGSVKDFFRYLGINRTLLMCYMFWIFSAAAIVQRGCSENASLEVSFTLTEGNVISKVAGKKVEVPCNVSVSNLTQLEWKRNGINLLSYKPPGNLHINNKEHDNLNTDISTSKGNLYALIIKRAETSHTGNYTCLITTPNGVHEQTWRLIITVDEDADNWEKLEVPITATVTCLFCLLFIFAMICLQRTCKRAKNNRPRTAPRRDPAVDIYENCLEIDYGHCYH